MSSKRDKGLLPLQASPPVICAHGGDTEAAPPNTMSAFHAAVTSGATCVEVDVSRTRDGALFVLHPRELRLLLGRRDVPQVGLGEEEEEEFYICSSRLGLIKVDHHHSGIGRNREKGGEHRGQRWAPMRPSDRIVVILFNLNVWVLQGR
jgi:glycerophosphoryl diester phosphodiesterase